MSQLKFRRKKSKKESSDKNHYIYYHAVNTGCVNCGEVPPDYYVISSRVDLCFDCFDRYFKIVDFKTKHTLSVVEEKKKGIAEKLHKKWLKQYKDNGGLFVSWNQRLNTFDPFVKEVKR